MRWVENWLNGWIQGVVITESFWLEDTIKITESNNNLTLALNCVPKNLIYASLKHLEGW